MSVVSDRVRSTIERLIHSPRFVVLSSVTQFVIDMAIWSLTAIAASYARFEYQGHHDPFGATQSSVVRVLAICSRRTRDRGIRRWYLSSSLAIWKLR
jgi:hypothetical protein